MNTHSHHSRMISITRLNHYGVHHHYFHTTDKLRKLTKCIQDARIASDRSPPPPTSITTIISYWPPTPLSTLPLPLLINHITSYLPINHHPRARYRTCHARTPSVSLHLTQPSHNEKPPSSPPLPTVPADHLSVSS
jgi:hypothetical protein